MNGNKRYNEGDSMQKTKTQEAEQDFQCKSRQIHTACQGRLLRLQSGGSYSASDLLWTGYAVQYQFLYGGSEIWK